MRTLLFLAVAGFAAAQQLSPAELEALARAEALINSLQPGWLKPKADRLARAAAGGPSIAAVAGDIVQSVGAGQAAVVKIDGITASTLTVTGATPDKFAATTLTVGAASIDVVGDDVVITGPVGGDYKLGDHSVNQMVTDFDQRVVDVDQAMVDMNVASGEAIKSAVFTLKQAVGEDVNRLAEDISNNKDDAAQAIVALENKVTTIVEPAIQGLKDDVAASLATVSGDVVKTREAVTAVSESLKKTQNLLLGISPAFPASNCAAILSANSATKEGQFWITSKIDKKSIKVLCKKVGSAFVSMGGNGLSKGEAGAGCFGNPETNLVIGSVWVDPDANAEDPSNAKLRTCGDGASKASPALTCKGIVKKFGPGSNGLFWVIGRNQEYLSAPFRVYCWNADRDGAGWTLGVVGYYCGHQRPAFANNNGGGNSGDYKGTSGDINRGDHWLSRNPGAYKLEDSKIRAIIGQSDHKNDKASGAASKFSYMSDQNGWNGYYAGSNREYLVMEGYVQRWRFHRQQSIKESNPRTNIMTAYGWNNNYGGSAAAHGDGFINWRGLPKCGHGGAGVSCNGQTSGSPQTSPNGGRGCNKNLSYDRWAGNLHWYMLNTNHDTYLYVCNGAQHSSNCRYALRTWFRTPSEDLIA